MYARITEVKRLLGIDLNDRQYDEELRVALTSADGYIDSLLEAQGLSVSSPPAQNIKDASKYFAAWLFRRHRDPAGAEAFYIEGNRFLDAYIQANKEITGDFRVVNP